jgi:hypothetical protein
MMHGTTNIKWKLDECGNIGLGIGEILEESS